MHNVPVITLEPEITAAEQRRLQELAWLRILDTPSEERFDRYSRLVADVFGVQTVTISLIAEDRQWHKSTVGIGGGDTPRDITFCTHTIAADFLEVPRCLRGFALSR